MKLLLHKVKEYIPRLCHELNRVRARQLIKRAENYLAKGAFDSALVCLKKSLSIDHNSTDAYSLMAETLMQGGNYISILSRIHEYLKPETYVEIGVNRGRSLALAHHTTKTIGIDPFPCIDMTLGSNAKIYPITSDEFFVSFNLFEELKSTDLSLAFIDGLHHSDQVLRDFINLERYSNKRTIIIIHDVLPITKLVATRIRNTEFWTGDVWKVFPFIINNRPDLVINVIPTPPSGLCIITNLNAHSSLLLEKYDAFISTYQQKDLPYYSLDSKEGEIFSKMYNIVPNKWENIRHLL